MIDCPECKGAGKVATNYRDNAKVEKPVEQKSFRVINAVTRWLGDWWPVIFAVTLVSGLLFGGCKIVNVLDEHDAKMAADAAKAEAAKPKHGYLIVQYNDANEVQRCWISPNKDAEVSVVGKGVYIYMADIKNPGVIPASVGVTDMSKCVSYRFE